MPKRGEKIHAGGTWTSARYWSFIRSNLRRFWLKWPVRGQVLNKAKRPSQLTDKRTKFEYQCAMCKSWNKGKNVQVDHITPCGSLKKPSDLARFVTTLFCEADNLRVLCKTCHHTVTQEERNKK